jgi:thiamine transport system substrate-binding protein
MLLPTKLFVLALLLALAGAQGLAWGQEESVILVTHDSFSLSEELLSQFEAESGLRVEILPVGDTGMLVNQAILSRNNPQGDVLFGVDNTFLGRALEADIFEAYTPSAAEAIPAEFWLDPQNRVTPIDFGDVCLNYDRAYFEAAGLALPDRLLDLAAPEYRGLLSVQNPALSSPGLAFLLLTVATFGETGDYSYLDFWADLQANEVSITPDWTTSYYGDFSLAGGDRPLVVSYASSPPAEVIFADPPLAAGAPAPSGAITEPAEMCFRQIEFAGVLRGAKNPAGARLLIDFMLSPAVQADLPLQMFVFPVLPGVDYPPEFVRYASLAENPTLMDYEAIHMGREEWIEAWTKAVLR